MKRLNEYNEENVTNWFGRQTPASLFFKFIALVIVVGLVFSVIGFFGGWFSEGKRIVSPENFKEQYAQIYEDYESLEAAAGNVCSLRTAEQEATTDDERSQRRSQTLATAQIYRKIAAEYDARWRNVFEAKVVGPRDTPTRAPSLEDMIKQVC